MKTGRVVLAAVVAGLLGVAARLATMPGGPAFGRVDFDGDASDVATDDATPVPVVPIGGRIPALAFDGLDGRRQDLATLLAGRPALLNFWASWCGPCLAEMPALSAFAAQQGANGVQVVGIALDDRDAVAEFLRRRPVGYPILLETPGAGDASVRLGDVRGVLPYSVLVGADGHVLKRHAGALSPGDLERWAAEAAPTRD